MPGVLAESEQCRSDFILAWFHVLDLMISRNEKPNLCRSVQESKIRIFNATQS